MHCTKMINLILFLYFTVAEVQSQIQLTQSDPQLKHPGESVTLTCTVSGFTLSSSYYMHWIRHAPGKKMEWLLYIRGDNTNTNYNTAIQSRATATTDSSTKVFLELRSLTTEDTAVYYCARQSQ
uniref:Immunoglobulin heavy variable 1-2 n=1 Tax=Erpetoichthys calabaricus TaxID=27687 RepID=A0A8C4RE86_ERPCA